MNIYQKLQAARVKLQSLNLKKSGNNKFAGYTYYELGDFLPPINTIMDELGLASFITFDADMARLTIVNSEQPEEQIVFTSPMKEANLKGAHDIQNLGAVETYQRRYLYMAAFDIVESDALDATQGNPEARGETTRRNNKNAAQSQPAPAAANVTHICSDCGQKVTPITGKSGKEITPEQLGAMSMKQYGMVLCAECQARRKAGQHE